jgi:hypothetical protein
MNVRQLIGLLSELSDQEAEVVIDDSEFDTVSILSVWQDGPSEDVVLSNYKPHDSAIVHYINLLYAREKR